MVASSSLSSKAWRSVDAGREHMIWWMQWVYLAAEDVASMLVATVAVYNIQMGAWLVVADGLLPSTVPCGCTSCHRLWCGHGS